VKFPSGKYGRQTLQFFPAPFRAPLRAFAALVFPWCGDDVLICNIEDRGWCVPSGRVEPEESSLEAAAREAREEAGAILQDLLYLGCYRITERNEVRWADIYTARVKQLVDIPEEFESIGRQYVSVEQLPDIYHLWNPLTAAVFDHAKAVMERHVRAMGRFGGG
jgi:8-oxo-dGTP diphosphatase